jgi:tetratricopeptide (TPR) repeat protein
VGTTVARTAQSPTLNADDYFVSARQKNELNDVQGSLADYNQSIALKPDNASAYNNRGILKYEKLNDVKGAIIDYRKSEQLYRQQGNAQKADQIKVYLSSLESR